MYEKGNRHYGDESPDLSQSSFVSMEFELFMDLLKVNEVITDRERINAFEQWLNDPENATEALEVIKRPMKPEAR